MRALPSGRLSRIICTGAGSGDEFGFRGLKGGCGGEEREVGQGG